MSDLSRFPHRDFVCNGKTHDITLKGDPKDWARRVLAEANDKQPLTVEMAKAALDIPSSFRRWDQ